MNLSLLSFYSRKSDSRFGGTYMTLLNTLLNLRGAWSSSVAIGMIDFLTFKECSLDHKNNCSTPNLKNVRNSNIISGSLLTYYLYLPNVNAHLVIVINISSF